MPRRNKREAYTPIDLTPFRERRALRRPGDPVVFKKPRPRHEIEAERAEQQRQARIQQGIDWETCVVPGCGRELMSWMEGSVVPRNRDIEVWVPMCKTHALVVYRTVKDWWPNDPDLPAELRQVEQRLDEQHAANEREDITSFQGSEGVIYFLRQNGLIKVGWSSDIFKRLKAYGPSVDILCLYPGTRQDETNLHRQLRGELAKGREWYHDGQAIQLFVQDALKRYGPPRPELLPGWTEPKAPAVKQRRRVRY